MLAAGDDELDVTDDDDASLEVAGGCQRRESMGTEHVSRDYESWDCGNAGDWDAQAPSWNTAESQSDTPVTPRG